MAPLDATQVPPSPWLTPRTAGPGWRAVPLPPPTSCGPPPPPPTAAGGGPPPTAPAPALTPRALPWGSRPATAVAAATTNPLFGDRDTGAAVPRLELPPSAAATVARPSWFGDLPSPGRLSAASSAASTPRGAGGWGVGAPLAAAPWPPASGGGGGSGSAPWPLTADRPPTAGLPWGGGATPRGALTAAPPLPPPMPPSRAGAAAPPPPLPLPTPRAPLAPLAADVPFLLAAPPPGAPPVRCTLLRGRGRRAPVSIFLEPAAASGGGDPPPPIQVGVALRRGARSRVVAVMGGGGHGGAAVTSGPPRAAALVKGNWAGTAYLATGPRGGQLAAVSYAASLLGGRGPRRVAALVPTAPGVGALADRAAAADAGVVALANVPPRWSGRAGAYVLDFGGRVTRPSVKNFQLVAAGGGGASCAPPPRGATTTTKPRPLLQFGRNGDDAFALDYAHPLTGLQAVAIALSALDGKLTCE